MNNMMKDNTSNKLPTLIPLLPLHGAVLLPRSQLPVPIFEVDYLSMVAESIKSHYMIGVVQPMLKNLNLEENLPLFKSGCLGKIIDINEIEENRLVITLSGISRFDIIEELSSEQGYRRALVSYDRYTQDMVEEVDFSFDRLRLLKALKDYFKVMDITPDWQEIEKTSNEKLITALAMVCPFEAREKQAILESPTLKEQSQLITTMIEIASIENRTKSLSCH
jgi:Lon protease-like protein